MGQVVVLKIAGKYSFLRVVRSLVRYSLEVKRAASDYCMRFRLLKRCAFLLCPPKVDPVNDVRRVFLHCFVMNLSGLRQVITIFFFISPRGFHGVKNTVCLVSRPARPPAMSTAPNRDLRSNEQPLWNTNSFQLIGTQT